MAKKRSAVEEYKKYFAKQGNEMGTRLKRIERQDEKHVQKVGILASPAATLFMADCLGYGLCQIADAIRELAEAKKGT